MATFDNDGNLIPELTLGKAEPAFLPNDPQHLVDRSMTERGISTQRQQQVLTGSHSVWQSEVEIVHPDGRIERRREHWERREFEQKGVIERQFDGLITRQFDG